MSKISVIIPIYNGKRYIATCYQSLTDQTLTDWEAVFIDDGSTDNSHELLLNLSVLDHRVKVIHKKNEGVAVAREIGIREANGEYVTFLDVDDTLVDIALEQFVKHFDSERTDIVIAGFNMVSEKRNIIKRILYPQMIISGNAAVDYMCTGVLRWQLCGKAFRKQLLLKTNTPRGLRSAEDMAVCLQATVKAREIVVLNRCLYNYVQVASSVTHSKALEISHDALQAAHFVEDEIGNDIDKVNLDCLFLLIISTALRSGIPANDVTIKEAIKLHGRFKSIRRLPSLKALNVGLYRYCNLNLARFLRL